MATNDTIKSTKSNHHHATKPNPKSTHPVLSFYPAFCFKASPTNFAWVKISAADIHRLKRRVGFGEQGLFFYENHPIRFVNVIGVIVARTVVPRRTILTIDDSTGATVDVVVLKDDTPAAVPAPATAASARSKSEPDANNDNDNDEDSKHSKETHLTATTRSPLDITPLVPGKVFQLKGTLSSFRSVIQINLERFFPVADTKTEMRFVEARTRFLTTVLSDPWVLEKGEIETLRREADEEGGRVEEEQERVRRRARKREDREIKVRKKIEEAWEREEAAREKEAKVVSEAGREYMRLRELKRRREDE
ncbi:OB-fold domain-containing protein [Aspergillus undulatus]|uniref:OB-fold domain-containing protein n=1 Tax=Aspergillus undulatus TaxID=1810928 RepID=UPI003CCD5168